MSRNPTKNIDYTDRDYEAFRESMINYLVTKIPEYTDTSETDAGIVILESLANGLDVLSMYLDNTANDLLLPTTHDRGIALLYAQCLGYTPYNQTATRCKQVFKLNGVRDEDTLIPKGTIVRTKGTDVTPPVVFETMDNLVIPKGKLGDEKTGDKYDYTVDVEQGQSIYQDVLGSSNGTPLQSFNLNYTQVIVDSIQLFVNEGQGHTEWKRVDNFIESDENSKVFTVSVDDFDVCTITFGNGLKGSVPLTYSNGIVANYRVGGGEIGNVNEGTINLLDSSVAYVEKTFNLKPHIRGHEKESLNSIKLNAPAFFRVRDRLVTLKDYSDLLKISFYEFLDVIAEKDSTNNRKVNLYYMLKDGYEFTNTFRDRVSDFINSRSMIWTSFEFFGYSRYNVSLSANMYVEKGYDATELKKSVENYIKTYTFGYGNMGFKDTLVKSDLESEIKNNFKGVLSFRITNPTEDIISTKSINEVLSLGSLNIQVNHI